MTSHSHGAPLACHLTLSLHPMELTLNNVQQFPGGIGTRGFHYDCQGLSTRSTEIRHQMTLLNVLTENFDNLGLWVERTVGGTS